MKLKPFSGYKYLRSANKVEKAKTEELVLTNGTVDVQLYRGMVLDGLVGLSLCNKHGLSPCLIDRTQYIKERWPKAHPYFYSLHHKGKCYARHMYLAGHLIADYKAATGMATEDCIETFRIIGGEYVSTQVGPGGKEALIRKPDKKLIEIIHEYSGIAFYHNHGPMMNFLEDYAYIGVDFLEPMEAPPWGDTDLGKAKEIIQDRYCMVGNLDDMEIIEKLDKEQVVKIARERIEQAGTRGFILSGTASGTYTEKGALNFLAMAEAAREYRVK